MSTRQLWPLAVLILAIPATLFPYQFPDWPGFYAGAKLANTQALYSFAASRSITSTFENPGLTWAFVRPPFYASILYPLGLLSPHTAFLAWEGLNLAALAGMALLLWPSPWTGLILISSSPIWISLRQGQDMSIILFLAAVVIVLLRSSKNTLAGIALALCSIKFPLFLLVPVFLIARKDIRATAGFLSGLVVLAGLSFVLYGAHWPAAYVHCLAANEAHLTTYSMLPFALWLRLSIIAVVASVCAILCLKLEDPGFAFAITAALGILVTPRMYVYDVAIITPALILLVKRYTTERGKA